MRWTRKGHEFDDIGGILAGKKDVYIYGAAGRGVEFHHQLGNINHLLGWNLTFVDNDYGKQQSNINGAPVVTHFKLTGVDRAKSLVIMCLNASQTKMIERLCESGFVFLQDVFSLEHYVQKYMAVHLAYQRNLAFVSSVNHVLTTRCNLSCRACLNFTPLTKNHTTLNVETAIRDIDVYFNAVDLTGRFQFTGGEPFLYPDLTDVLEHLGSLYRQRVMSLEIVTNGTVKPAAELCDALRRHDVLVYLDDYRDAVGQTEAFEETRSMLERHSVRYARNTAPRWFDLLPEGYANPQRNPEELSRYFDVCGCPWTTLDNGRLAACNYACYAAKAGIQADVPEEYFPLDSVSSSNKKELVEFRLRYSRKGYTEFCRRCAGFSDINWHSLPAAQQISKDSL